MMKPSQFYLLLVLGLLALSMLAVNIALFGFGRQARSELASRQSAAEQSAKLAVTYAAGLEALAALDRDTGDSKLSEMLSVLEPPPGPRPPRGAIARVQ